LPVGVGVVSYGSCMSSSRFRRSAGGVTSLGLHLVWCPKRRRRLLGGRVAVRLGGLLEGIAAGNTWEIVAKEVMPDHVHLFVGVRPVDAPAEGVRKFKDRTGRVLRHEFPWLAKSKVLWSKSCFAVSVGYVSESPVRRYIEHQWDAVA